MVGGDAMRDVVAKITRYATAKDHAPALLHGPTGVGKELAARVMFQERTFAVLQQLSKQEAFQEEPALPGLRYFAMNCAALPEELATSELFGIYKETASYVKPNPGAILSAGEGVVLLDEISFLKPLQQALLLRAVQPPYHVAPVGAPATVRSSALAVAAMSEDPERMIADHRLLPELFARFRSCVVRIPTLAERPCDIPALLSCIAGGAVRMDEMVLRWLLADRHSLNVRGLYGIVSRARQRCHGHSSATDNGTAIALQITLDDVGAGGKYSRLRNLANSGGNSRLGNRVFEFVAPRYDIALDELFESTAQILSVIGSVSAGKITLRRPSEDNMKNLRAVTFANEGPEALLRRWLEVINRAMTLTSGKERAFRVISHLFGLRFPKGTKSEHTQKYIAMLLLEHTGKSEYPGLDKHVLREALGVPSETFRGWTS
jgi:hypothetical protein